jgi:hypothetical protein
MFKNKAMLLIASTMFAMPALLQAQGVTPTAGGKGGTVSADQLITRYSEFAGGPANAKSLVNGLRTGEDITLDGGASAPTRVLLGQETYRKGTQLPSDGKEREYVKTEQRQIGMGPCPPKPGTPPGLMCPIFADFDIYNVFETRPGQPVKETFSPKPAAPMGFGNVDIALALTEAKLRPNAKPKPAELKSNLLEILGKRAGGEGWGEIAKSYGFDLK